MESSSCDEWTYPSKDMGFSSTVHFVVGNFPSERNGSTLTECTVLYPAQWDNCYIRDEKEF
jgi:hypothetical protein